ncbi:putative cycloinulo-oligosaccharide fructanotransferase [Myxococcus hansupus]|uniref:Putative cycloinulo-oligosaccharide fructanotransferase n=1 Tax=Pseudomyxococcus hansupus TaxID=1297742 RepID=A0A0H4WXQ4_9BACT|nr:ELWxxDGT repeat protein [Myxococcus hansupus]AKQ66393.1 putative cycloinulo-oligosaccharide fructanotransferase [Myxococcus hansupus]
MKKPWRCFPVVLPLLAACELPAVDALQPSHNEAPSRPQREWEPCGLAAPRLLDLHPGPGDAKIGEQTPGPTGLFFTADDGRHGTELWTSSGTHGDGTRLLRDIAGGAMGADPTDLTRVGDRLFFIADDGMNGRALWTSDGTRAGTTLLKRILPVRAGLGEGQALVAYKDRIYFAAEHAHGTRGTELWTSDGTPAGTREVADLAPGPESSYPRRFAVHDGSLYFVISRGEENWLVRGEGGASFTPLHKVFEDTVIFGMKSVDEKLFFLVDPDEGEATLHVTDGTPAGTRRLRFFPGEYPHDLVAMNGRLYFSAGSGTDEGEELWVSDGTVSGTRRLKDIRPGRKGSSPASLAVLGDRIYFSADDGKHGRELWVSDGTFGGTKLFKDLIRGTRGSSPSEVTTLHDWLFFSAENSNGKAETWISNGSTSGFWRIDTDGAHAAKGFVRSGWDVFFTAETRGSGRELHALPFRPTGECAQARP